MTTCPLPRDQVRQIVFIHQITLPGPTVLIGLSRVFFLVLSQYQPGAPVTLATANYVSQLAIGTAMCGLGHTVNVAALVVDKIFLQVQPRGA